MEQHNTGQLVRESWADLSVPLSVGVLGFLAGWALWQLINAPCPFAVFGNSPLCLNRWEENVVATAAINPGIAGWGIGTAVGVWLRDFMLRKLERERDELQKELRDELKRAAEDRRLFLNVLDKVVRRLEGTPKRRRRLTRRPPPSHY